MKCECHGNQVLSSVLKGILLLATKPGQQSGLRLNGVLYTFTIATFASLLISILGYKGLGAGQGFWQQSVWQQSVWQQGVWQQGVWQQGVWQQGVWHNLA